MPDMETMGAFGLGEKVMAMSERVRTMNAINPGATGEYRMKIDGDTFVIAVRLEQIAENANCSDGAASGKVGE
jgi:hypothetical protein